MLNAPKNLTNVLNSFKAEALNSSLDTQLAARLAGLHIRNNDFKAAEEVFERILKAEPDNVGVMVELARCQTKRGAFSEALFNLERALEVKPRCAEAFIGMANLSEAQKRHDKHLYFLRLASEAAPERAEIRLALAEAMRVYADFSGAIKQYELVLQINPKSEAALFSISTVYMKQNNLAGAAKYLTALVSQNPCAFDAHFNLGICFFRQKKYEAAAKHFNYAKRKKDLSQKAMYLLSRCCLALNDSDKAIVTLEALLEQDSNNTSFLKTLAEAYEQANELDCAAELYKKLAEIAPERPEFMLNYANSLLKLGSLKQCEKALTALFKRHPGHIEGHLLLASLYKAKHGYKAAKEEYMRVLLVFERSVKAYEGLASVYKILNDSAKEREALEKAVEYGSSSPEILLRLGCLERQMRLPSAIERFKRVAEAAPLSPFAREAEYFIKHRAA